MQRDPIHIMMISPHGLIRGRDLELGRDPDTGGQTKYEVEPARSLAETGRVEEVELVTRIVEDPAVSSDYASETERLRERARIVRIPCGSLERSKDSCASPGSR